MTKPWTLLAAAVLATSSLLACKGRTETAPPPWEPIDADFKGCEGG